MTLQFHSSKHGKWIGLNELTAAAEEAKVSHSRILELVMVVAMMDMSESVLRGHISIKPRFSPHKSTQLPCTKLREMKATTWKLRTVATDSSNWPKARTVGGLLSARNCSRYWKDKNRRQERVFFVDVNPLCYDGRTPSLHSFANWISLFFSQVSHSNPVIAVTSLPPSLSQTNTHTHTQSIETDNLSMVEILYAPILLL